MLVTQLARAFKDVCFELQTSQLLNEQISLEFISKE